MIRLVSEHRISTAVRLVHLFAYVYLGVFLLNLLDGVLTIQGLSPSGRGYLPEFVEPFVWRAPVITTPLVISAAWWIRRGASEPTAKWRARALIAALVLVTINALMFSGWVLYHTVLADEVTRRAWNLVTVIAEWLTIPAMLLALVGEGSGRTLLICASLCGFMLWVVPAIF